MIPSTTALESDYSDCSSPNTASKPEQSRLSQLIASVNEAKAEELPEREVTLMLETLHANWSRTEGKSDSELKPLFEQYRQELLELRQLQDWQDDADPRLTEELKERQSELKKSFLALRTSLTESLWLSRETPELVATLEATKHGRRDCRATVWAHLVDGCAERWKAAADAVEWLAAKSGGKGVLHSAAYSPGRTDMRDWFAELLCYYGFSCTPASADAQDARIEHPMLPGTEGKRARGFAYLLGNPTWEDAETELREDLTRAGLDLDGWPRHPSPPQTEPSAIETPEQAKASAERICSEVDEKQGEDILQQMQALMTFMEAHDQAELGQAEQDALNN